MLPPITAKLAYLTADLPGIGGRIKARPEDFLVEELPLYEAGGTGEHLYLFIEKQSMVTTDVVRRLAKLFHVRRGDIGFAGMKDKHAITRQHFSVWLPKADQASIDKAMQRFEFLPFKLLWVDRHSNKLRRGHLRGNRFVIRVRDVEPSCILRAKPILERLQASGIPDFLGEQRFGMRQNNHLVGRAILKRQWRLVLDLILGGPDEHDPPWAKDGRRAYEVGDYATALQHWPRMLRTDRQALDALRQGHSDEKAVRAIDRLQRHFYVSAFQSYLFNMVLDRRLREGTFDQLVPGDLAWKHDNRSLFAVDQATAELENSPAGRVASHDISPSGPLWSADMPRCTDEPDRWELDALHSFDMTVEDLEDTEPIGTKGVRRPTRTFLSNVEYSSGVDEHGSYLRLGFDLPRGSFATIVTRELMKNEAGHLSEDEDD